MASGDVVINGLLLAGLLVLGAAVQFQDPHHPAPYWQSKNGDYLSTGYSDNGVDMLDTLKQAPAWSFHEDDNSVIRAAPLIDGDKNVYLSTIKGNVYKFSEDGERLWKFEDTCSIPSIGVLYDGTMFVTNVQGIVTALDMVSGVPRWQKSALEKGRTLTSGDTWSMAGADGIILTNVGSDSGAGNNLIVALDAASGSVKWTFEPDSDLYNALESIKDDSVVFADKSGAPYRLDLHTGALVWKAAADGNTEGNEDFRKGFTTGGAILSPDGDAVYVTSNMGVMKEGFVTAFRFSDGKLLWRTSTGKNGANNAAAVGTINGKLTLVLGVGENPAFPLKSGKGLFSHWMPDGSPLISKLPVYDVVGGHMMAPKEAQIWALDAHTGERIWKFDLPNWHGWAAGDRLDHVCLPDAFGNAAISGDGVAYLGFQSGKYYGIFDKNHDGQIDEAAGEVVAWNFKNAFQGSPGIAPGMIVATPCNGLSVFKKAAASGAKAKA